MNTYKRFDIEFTHGSGAFLYDKKGGEYLDFTSGLAVNILGHNHPAIVSAIARQAKKGLHYSNLFVISEQEKAAQKLAEKTGYDKVFFCNSGSEANEAAIKLTKKVTGKNKFISFTNGFHGRTSGSLSITGKEKIRKQFEPLLSEVVFCEYNNMKQFESLVDESVAGVFFEIIQGEGGVSEINKEFFDKIFELSNKYGFLTICDEVQTGVGRTGYFLASEKFGKKPDITSLAKGLSGGLPVGAILSTEKISKSFKTGDHGTTFGGNPLVTSVLTVVVDNLYENKILGSVKVVGSYLKSSLESLKKDYPQFIHKVTGFGFMQGVWLKSPKLRDTVVKTLLYEKKVTTSAAGDRTLRLLPPLITTKENVDDFIIRIKEVFDNL